MELEERLIGIMAAVFGAERDRSLMEAVRDEHPAWDSLAHLALITAVESDFSVRFTMQQVASISDARALASAIRAQE